MKFKHIYDPLFRQNYYWIVAKSFQDFQKAAKKELDYDVPLSEKEDKFGIHLSGGIRYITTNNCRTPIIWIKELKPSLVVHECWHAVWYTLSCRGIYLSEDSEEVYAYALEFLVENILK